jgi:hypothetical protein
MKANADKGFAMMRFLARKIEREELRRPLEKKRKTVQQTAEK